MSDRIRVPDDLDQLHIGGCPIVSPIHLAALLDVAEAAQAVKRHDDNDPSPMRSTLEALYAVLARFDFGDENR